VNIRAVNTGARAQALVQTSAAGVIYDGAAQIDGVPGTAAPVACGLMPTPSERPALLTLEHASGTIDVSADFDMMDNRLELRSAGLVRTARLLAKGQVIVPKGVWED
jgi:2-methylaconitate cis-trans-isomerase PrpF